MVAPGQFLLLAAGFPIRPMATIRQIRHANLLLLIAKFDTIQAFADKVGRSHSQISQLRNQIVHSGSGKPRSVGDGLARDIEKTLGLPEGWMDQPHSHAPADADDEEPEVVVGELVRNTATLRQFASMVVKAGDDMTPEQQARYRAALEALERGAAGKGH